MRWQEWLLQTERHFRDLDVLVLPVGEGRSIDRSPIPVLILANSPVWEWLTARCQALGLNGIQSANVGFDELLPRASGQQLVITCVGDALVLPEQHRARYLPVPAEEFARLRAAASAGVRRRTLDDGTRVTLLYAPDLDAMRELVATFEPR